MGGLPRLSSRNDVSGRYDMVLLGAQLAHSPDLGVSSEIVFYSSITYLFHIYLE